MPPTGPFQAASDPIEMTVIEARDQLEIHPETPLIDVREDFEREICSLPKSQQLTEALAETMLADWDREQMIIFQCHHGGRSRAAAEYFKQQGFNQVRNLTGGIDAWSVHIDSALPRY